MEYAKLGGMSFSVVTEETFNFRNTVTSNPVENGENITDHVENQPLKIAITGLIVGEYAAQQYELLVQWWREGKPLLYIGRGVAENVVIETFPKTTNKSVSNGFTFTMTLTQIKVATKQTIQINEIVIPKPRVKKTSSKGRSSKNESSVNKTLSNVSVEIVDKYGQFTDKITDLGLYLKKERDLAEARLQGQIF